MSTIPVENCASDLELHGYTSCAHCGQFIMQSAAVHKVYYKDGQQEVEDFCSELHKEQWVLDQIRRMGL